MKTEYELWRDELHGHRHNPWPKLLAQFLVVSACVVLAVIYLCTYGPHK